ncbi:MAG: adenylyltransferase/cytidyltransferase family protein [Chitinophagaceae bacterium]|nr:adenylyltransferase/cytidyltransferase family protein [Chitinophagaceae bacterium]
MSAKKVFVSGCFDLLHSGHVAFLNEAASFGELYVCIGSDRTVNDLKGRYPVTNQDERKYMIDALRCVHECRISTGSGLLDFVDELEEIRPDIFVVNEDGHTQAKEHLCKEKGIEYKVLKRIPHENLPARSTTKLRTNSIIPFRIDIAGGWLDQPYVSKFYPGPVITISIEPTVEFNNRSGMASSSRNKAIELWKTVIPAGNPEQLAKVLFSYENPPGTQQISGSQDSIGIVFPGLNKLNYKSGDYWPASIESVYDEDILQWLEDKIYLLTLGPRVGTYDVLADTNINEENAKALADAAEGCWEAILRKDLQSFGKYFTDSFYSQIKMFPRMVDDEIMSLVDQYKDQCVGYKLSGSGGGGYLILISDRDIDNALRIKIRRRDD